MNLKQKLITQLHIPDNMKKIVSKIIDEAIIHYQIVKKVKKYQYDNKYIIDGDRTFEIFDGEVNKALSECSCVFVGLVSLGEKSHAHLEKTTDVFESYIINEFYNMLLEETSKKIWCELSERNDLGLTMMIAPGEREYKLSTQKLIFNLLKPQGIFLNEETLFISPIKTLTFIIGMGEDIKKVSYNKRCKICGFNKCFINIKINDQEYRVKSHSRLIDVMIDEKIKINNYCGGNHTCGKCSVLVKKDNHYLKTLACEINCYQGLEVKTTTDNSKYKITSDSIFKISTKDVIDKTTGIVFDVGTTTIVGAIYGLQSRKKLKTIAQHNQQHIYGLDVISRINYTIENEDGLDRLYQTIITQLNLMTDKLITDKKALSEIIIVGNPTMISIINRFPLETLAIYPYKNNVDRFIHIEGKDIGIDKKVNIIFIYGVSSFIGSDIISGIVACDFINSEKQNLIIDLGTNGEIALGNKDKIIACSTAAGPAFEGATIECGVPSIDGAIYEILISEDIEYKTINNKKAIGFCGSGVIDIVAKLNSVNKINEKGAYTDQGFIIDVDEKKLVLTQNDIRELQLAKSAIITGIEILTNKMNITYHQIEKVYLSGGFGSNINIDSAIMIGLIPVEFRNKIKSVGNSALHGGVLYLLEPKYRSIFNELKPKIEVVDLVNEPSFSNKFIENLQIKAKE